MRPAAIGLRHVALFVSDLGACERFYVDVVGFVVEWRPDSDNVYLRLAGDNLALHRHRLRGTEEDTVFRARTGQHFDHLGIAVPRPEDVDAWADHFVAHGLLLKKSPQTHRDGARSFYIDDPDGNTVQFIYHPPMCSRP